MKKRELVFVSLFVASILFIASCSVDPTIADDLIGTRWENQALGTGDGITFDTATTGTKYVLLLGEVIVEVAFTYTYDTSTLSGEIILETNTENPIAFTLSADGKSLTYSESTYSYTIFSRSITDEE